jgi:hypothetical protein
MALDVVSQSRCFGGIQFTYQHQSSETGTPMRFAAFVPPRADHRPVPVVWFLSGLTCNEENFTVKAGAQRIAAELGLLLIAPDTSPRGDAVPGDPAGSYDFGLGAGFYVDARMRSLLMRHERVGLAARELDSLPLTERERDVLALVASGKTNSEVATLLAISPRNSSEASRACFRETRRRDPHGGSLAHRRDRSPGSQCGELTLSSRVFLPWHNPPCLENPRRRPVPLPDSRTPAKRHFR